MFEGLDEDSVQYIKELTEWLPTGEKVQAQKEIIASIRKVQEIQKRKEERVWLVGGSDSDELNNLQSRIADFAWYIRDMLNISDEIDDQEILDAFSEDFPEYQDMMREYLNNWDETIFSILEEDPWAVQQQADQLEAM